MSEIRATTISDAAGTGPIALTKQSAAKAWVNLDGNATPISIRGSVNISSATDLGAGYYEFTYSSNMSDANYSSTTSSQAGACGGVVEGSTYTSSTVRYLGVARLDSYTQQEHDLVCITANGDLA